MMMTTVLVNDQNMLTPNQYTRYNIKRIYTVNIPRSQRKVTIIIEWRTVGHRRKLSLMLRIATAPCTAISLLARDLPRYMEREMTTSKLKHCRLILVLFGHQTTTSINSTQMNAAGNKLDRSPMHDGYTNADLIIILITDSTTLRSRYTAVCCLPHSHHGLGQTARANTSSSQKHRKTTNLSANPEGSLDP